MFLNVKVVLNSCMYKCYNVTMLLGPLDGARLAPALHSTTLGIASEADRGKQQRYRVIS